MNTAITQNRTVAAVAIVDSTLDHLPSLTELSAVVRDRAERTFGRRVDLTLLERFSGDAAARVLVNPEPRLYAYLPDLALREVRDALERYAA